ncbi:hypothetical protein ACFV06_17610 [Streptomyces sp. NPDC059618]|uniref:hypothetical protein n=1 Tax=Streptomyces sp. NPDC059618 TaxID=3346887 RepID=UPI0036CD9C98
MQSVHDEDEWPDNRWIFGLEEIPASDKDETGLMHRVAPAYGMTVIRAPEGTQEAVRWAAEEIVSLSGPEFMPAALLLAWLQIEAGDEQSMGVESCRIERVDSSNVRLCANFGQWDDLIVPNAEVRCMLIDMMQFVTKESRRPLPAWRILRLGVEEQ